MTLPQGESRSSFLDDLTDFATQHRANHWRGTFAEFLAAREDLDETTKSDVDTIYKEAQRASRITSNLLSFARKHNPEKSLISINEVIEKSLELHLYRMKVNNIEVVTDFDPDLPITMVDSHQMQQVFVNIITNAEQVMKEAHGLGEIRIKTQKVGKSIRIVFSDNGPGIPPEIQSRLFDPFFTTKAPGKGTGLGLDISYNIVVHKHRGEIKVTSKPGKTCFEIWLPINFEAK